MGNTHRYGLPLTDRMHTVLRLLATGHSTQEAADKIHRSVRATGALIAAAKSRLGAKTTTQAVVMWATQEGEG